MNFVILILGSFLIVHFPWESFTSRVEDGPLKKIFCIYFFQLLQGVCVNFSVWLFPDYKFKSQTQSGRRPSLVSALAPGNIPYIFVNSSNHSHEWLFYFIQHVQVFYSWHIFRSSNPPCCQKQNHQLSNVIYAHFLGYYFIYLQFTFSAEFQNLWYGAIYDSQVTTI